MEENNDVIGTMLFIKNMLILDVEELKRTGQPRYYPVTDKNQMVSIIRRLEVLDAKALGDAIEARASKYAIDYKIRNFTCSKCGNDIGEIPVDMETLLFTQILQM
jgi:hypothetical protein